jgi:hypothetical protein
MSTSGFKGRENEDKFGKKLGAGLFLLLDFLKNLLNDGLIDDYRKINNIK